jgi:hypothetical protein
VSTKSIAFFGPNWAFASLPFPVRLATALSSEHTHVIGEEEAAPSACDDGVAPAASAEHPEADPGEACAFVGFLLGPKPEFMTVSGFNQGASPTGAILLFATPNAGEDVLGIGSYAVTAAP